MACATLKRSLDFDPVHNQTNARKRQRCAPMCISPSNSPPLARCESSASIFANICPKLTPEMMAAGVREEISRLYGKKQLHLPKLESTSSDTLNDLRTSPHFAFPANMKDKPLFTFRQVVPDYSVSQSVIPLVGFICERLINERENQIREEYDRFLNTKLSEQYEAFVKFSNDQLQRRFEAGSIPSYLS